MPTKKTNTIKLVLYSLSLFTGICAGAPVYAGDCNPAGPLGSYFCSGGLPIPPSGNPQQDLTGFPLQITTATTSDTFGIKVLHGGGATAAINLTSPADLGTGSGAGIDFNDEGDANTIIGPRYGILAESLGTGDVRIISSGVIIASSTAIRATNTNIADDITVHVNDASSDSSSTILVDNNSLSGNTEVISTGQVTSNANGVGLFLFSDGGRVDVTANNVTSPSVGISIIHSGAGPSTVNTTGNIMSSSRDGISVDHTPSANTTSHINISTTGPVSGGEAGINVRQQSASNTTLTISSIVSGGTKEAIYVHQSNASSLITINLNDGAEINAGATGSAMFISGFPSTEIRVNSGASINGALPLSIGSDDLVFDGGDFSGVTLFAARSGDDTLTFRNTNGLSLLDGSIVTNWERIILDPGSTIQFSNNQINVGTFDVLGGALSMQDQPHTYGVLTVNGDFGGGGIGDNSQLALDVLLGLGVHTKKDRLKITGDTIGHTTIDFNIIDGTGAATTGDGLLVVEVLGNSSGTFHLPAPIQLADYAYDLHKAANGNWYLQSTLNCVLPGDMVAPFGVINIQDVAAVINHAIIGTRVGCSDIDNDNNTSIADVIAAINLVL